MLKTNHKIKPIWSDEVIEILTEVRIEELLLDCHHLRKALGLKDKDGDYVTIQALLMYKRSKERILRKRLERCEQ